MSAVAAVHAPPYRDRNVLRWLAGFGVSLIGDQVYYVALAWTAAQTAGAGGAGLVLATASVPRLLLLLVGGAAVDRWGARRLMLSSDALRCAVMVAAAATTATASPSLAILIAVALVFGAVDAVFLPAVGALPPHLVAPEHLAGLQGMRVTLARGAIVAGAPLGGVVVATYGVATAFAVNAVTFAVSLLALAATRVDARPRSAPATAAAPRRGIGAEVRAGLGVAARSPLLRTVILVSAVAELGFTGPFNVGVTLLAQEHGWGAVGVGLVVGGFGVGAALAAGALVVLGRIPRAGLVVGIVATVMGGAITGIGYAPSRPWAAAASIVLGASAGLAGALGTALLQAHIPPGYLGRVMSLSSLAGFGGVPVSYALTGLVAGLWGPATAFLGGAALTVGAAVGALSSRALRGAELPASNAAAHDDRGTPDGHG